LHSIKSKRKSVLQSLSKARNQGGIQRQQHMELPAQTVVHRRRLDDVNAILQQPIQRTECTLAAIFSHSYQSTAVADAPVLIFDRVLAWDVETLTRLQQTSIELSQLIHSETLPWTENPFRFVQAYDSTLSNDNRLFEYLQQFTEQMSILQEAIHQQEVEVGCHFDGTFGVFYLAFIKT